MLPWLLGAVAAAPLYWLAVPARLRPAAVTVGSLVGLGLYDPRLVVLVTALALGLYLLIRAAARTRGATAAAIVVVGLTLLTVLFVWNKQGGRLAVLPSQGGLVLLGVSYLVLKAAAALIEAARGGLEDLPRPGDILRWLAFLPTYPSGPMEDLDHFRAQQPVLDRERALGGLERILFGLVKALVVSSLLGDWAAAIIAEPAAHARLQLLLALYAFALRFYFDFSGYSDVAIGLGALFGYEIEENFDWPLVRRNLVQLWQHWHMTLTRWLRLYLFIPVSRGIVRAVPGSERWAAAAGQVAAMVVCGLWHGVAWNFAVWGLTQALGLIWVGLIARDVGRALPRGLVAWWRRSPLAYAASTALTFTAFSVSLVFIVGDVPQALHYLRLLAGV